MLQALNEYPFDPGLALHRAVEAKHLSDQEVALPLLDLGCSDGRFAKLYFKILGMTTRSGLSVGLDNFKPILEKAKMDARYGNLLAGEAETLPFRDQTFATVIANSFMTHIQHLENVLREIARVLQSQGVFIFTVPSVFFGNYLFLV